jgi:hypothetical protein
LGWVLVLAYLQSRQALLARWQPYRLFSLHYHILYGFSVFSLLLLVFLGCGLVEKQRKISKYMITLP